MPEGRPPIPAELQRAVMVEAGHRCAIPTCRSVAPLHIEHIDDWAKVREHKFENLIVLCANCHGLKGKGPRQLDRKSLRQYKANLGVLNNRYGDFEQRVIQVFADNPGMNAIEVNGGGQMLNLQLLYLLRDGMVQIGASTGGAQIVVMGVPTVQVIALMPRGRELVDRWKNAEPLQPSVIVDPPQEASET